MFSRARKLLISGVGAAAVVMGAATPGIAAGDDTTLPSAVETFDYPGAAKISKERGIELQRGDGHIILGDCGIVNDIVVTTNKPDGPDQGKHCFKVTGSGKAGRLNMSIKGVTSVAAGKYGFRVAFNDFPGISEVTKGGVRTFDQPVTVLQVKL